MWHLDHDMVLDYFKDYDFWIMIYLFTIFIVIALRGMNAFPLKFPGRGWVSVDGQFPQIFE